MMLIRFGIVLAFAVAAMPAQAQHTGQLPGEGALRLAPSMPWNLDYDDDSCALRRVFGPEGQQVYLELRQFGPHDTPQVIVGSADLESKSPTLGIGWLPGRVPPTLVPRSFELSGADGYHGRLLSLPTQLAFPEERAREIAVASPLVSEEALALLDRMTELEPDGRAAQRLAQDNDFVLARIAAREALQASPEYLAERDAAESEVTGLFVGEAFEEHMVLETGEMHEPMGAMRSCLDELVTHWGIDAEAHASLSRRVWPADHAKLVRSLQRAYPNGMEARRIPGFIRARLDISESGEPTACHIQAPISEPAFEREACEQLMDEGEFFPALDAQGNPIASYYTVAIAYVMN